MRQPLTNVPYAPSLDGNGVLGTTPGQVLHTPPKILHTMQVCRNPIIR